MGKQYHFEEVPGISYSDAAVEAPPAGDAGPDICLAAVEGINLQIRADEDERFWDRETDGKTVLWNRVDTGQDFCYALWHLLGEPVCRETEGGEEDEDAVEYRSFYYHYSQVRYFEPKYQLVNVFRKLESSGYLRAYTLKPGGNESRWRIYGKSDGSIDAAVVDMSFKNDPQLMEQVESLLWERPDTEPVEVMAECCSEKGDAFISISDCITKTEYRKRVLTDPSGFERSISWYLADTAEKYEDGILEVRRLVDAGIKGGARAALYKVYGAFSVSFYVYETQQFFDYGFNLEAMIYDGLEKLYRSEEKPGTGH